MSHMFLLCFEEAVASPNFSRVQRPEKAVFNCSMVGNHACTHVSVEHDLLNEIFADLPPIFLVISSDDNGYKSIVGGPGQCVLVAPSPKKPWKHV